MNGLLPGRISAFISLAALLAALVEAVIPHHGFECLLLLAVAVVAR